MCCVFVVVALHSFFVGGRVRVQIYPVIVPNIKKSNQLKAQKQTKNVPRRPCTEIKRQKNGVLKPNKYAPEIIEVTNVLLKRATVTAWPLHERKTIKINRLIGNNIDQTKYIQCEVKDALKICLSCRSVVSWVDSSARENQPLDVDN